MGTRTSLRFPQVIDNISIFFVSPVENTTLIQEMYLGRGLSLAQIARQLGVARSTVSKRIGKLGITKPQNRPNYLLSQIPFGWRESKGTLVPNTAEQKVIVQMTEWRNTGLSLREIANRLTLSGIRTKNKGTWQARTVSRILERAADTVANPD